MQCKKAILCNRSVIVITILRETNSVLLEDDKKF